MESILIFLVVSCLMSSPVLGISQATSCSMVSGKIICQNQNSAGNSAAAFSGAAVGGGQTYQDAYAGAGNPGQWDYGRQTVYGTVPGAYNGAPPSGTVPGAYSGAPPSGTVPGAYNGAPPSGPSGVYSSSSSSGFYPGKNGGGFGTSSGGFAFSGSYPAQGAAGGFPSAGGFPVGGGGFAFGGGFPAQGAAGGLATGGIFPFGGGYTAQAPAGNPGAPNQGKPQGFDPFAFVRPFLGGGGQAAFAGGFAGFPFGRR